MRKYTTCEQHWNWIQNPTKYSTIHAWLIRDFGKADRCENITCKGKSRTYDWALIKGKDYKRLRNVFMMLCRSCHMKYDMTYETWKKKYNNAIKRKKDEKGRFI